jgi:hypothetical protein
VPVCKSRRECNNFVRSQSRPQVFQDFHRSTLESHQLSYWCGFPAVSLAASQRVSPSEGSALPQAPVYTLADMQRLLGQRATAESRSRCLSARRSTSSRCTRLAHVAAAHAVVAQSQDVSNTMVVSMPIQQHNHHLQQRRRRRVACTAAKTARAADSAGDFSVGGGDGTGGGGVASKNQPAECLQHLVPCVMHYERRAANPSQAREGRSALEITPACTARCALPCLHHRPHPTPPQPPGSKEAHKIFDEVVITVK